jgi:hypothetical protein
MKVLEKIGKGKRKVVAFYPIIRVEKIETKYGVLREIHISQLRKKDKYFSELEFIIDDGERIITRRFYLEDTFYHVAQKIKNNMFDVLRQLSIV